MGKLEKWKTATPWELQALCKAYEDTGLTPEEMLVMKRDYLEYSALGSVRDLEEALTDRESLLAELLERICGVESAYNTDSWTSSHAGYLEGLVKKIRERESKNNSKSV